MEYSKENVGSKFLGSKIYDVLTIKEGLKMFEDFNSSFSTSYPSTAIPDPSTTSVSYERS